MQCKCCLKAALGLALVFAGWLASGGPAWAEIYVGRLIAEDLFDKLKFSGRIAVWPLDAAQAREAGLTASAAAALTDTIRIAIQQIGASKGLSFVEREAIGKVFQEQQFARNAKDSEFERLAHQANADALVLISIHRKDGAELVVSARLVRSKGSAIGQILVTSKAYDVAMAESSMGTADGPARGAATPTVKPDTVTPTGATAYRYGTYYAYTPAYAVSSAPAYTYTVAPAYYIRAPVAVPAYPVGYAR